MTTPPNSDAYAQSQAPIPQNHSNLAVYALIGVLLIVLGGAAGYFAYQARTLQLENQALISSDGDQLQEPIVQIVSTALPSYPHIYKKNEELWLLQPTGEEQQLTETGGSITSYDYAKSDPLIAFVHGNRIEQGEFHQIEPIRATVMNYETGESNELIEFVPLNHPEKSLEFVDGVVDVSFSSDNSLIAITTSQSLSVYDMTTAQTREVFYIPYAGGGGSGVFNYSIKQFAPDNNKILVNVGLYEGTTYAWVDLKTNELTHIDYPTSYAGGPVPLTWVTNNQVLMAEYGDPDFGLPEFPSLFLASYPDLEQEIVLEESESNKFIDAVTDGTSTVYLLKATYNYDTDQQILELVKLDLAGKKMESITSIILDPSESYQNARLHSVRNTKITISTSIGLVSQAVDSYLPALFEVDLMSGEMTRVGPQPN